MELCEECPANNELVIQAIVIGPNFNTNKQWLMEITSQIKIK